MRKPHGLRGDLAFAAYFKTALLPALRRFEGVRLRRRLVVAADMGMAFAVGFAVLPLLLTAAGKFFHAPELRASELLFLRLVLAAIAMAIALSFGRRSTRDTHELKREFSVDVIDRVAEYSLPGTIGVYGDSLRPGDFHESGLYDAPIDRVRGGNYYHAMLGKTGVQFSRLKVETRMRGDKFFDLSRYIGTGWGGPTIWNAGIFAKRMARTVYRPVFDGWLFAVDFFRFFKGTTIIVPDIAENKMGWVGKKLQEFIPRRDLELVKLEDPEFERRFAVYSTGQLDARYVVSPKLMRTLASMDSHLDCRMALSFNNSRLSIAFPGMIDHFGKDGRMAFTNPLFCRQLHHAIKCVRQLTEDIELNQKIWRDSTFWETADADVLPHLKELMQL